MSNIEEVIVTISIDTECDHDINWARSKPLTFESITEGLPNRLQPAFDQVGAVPTYLLTVEVMEDEPSVEALKSLKGNFEYGTHLHAAFIEPEKKFHDYAGIDSPDFQCSYAPEIEYQKLKNLSELFERRFNYKPTSFRAGRYGASADSINSLERLGYKVDTSVTPHIRWTEPNAVVDFRKAPEQPYFPAPGKIAEAGNYTSTRILEAPVTVKPRYFRDPRWFRPWFASVDQMKDIFRYHLKKHSACRVVSINMMFHSMEIIEKASPYPQTAD
ncbi:MAG: hypothetical protein ACI9XK_004205, partial [Granulosicoccus sp.]